jgi:hypothetical protein
MLGNLPQICLWLWKRKCHLFRWACLLPTDNHISVAAPRLNSQTFDLQAQKTCFRISSSWRVWGLRKSMGLYYLTLHVPVWEVCEPNSRLPHLQAKPVILGPTGLAPQKSCLLYVTQPWMMRACICNSSLSGCINICPFLPVPIATWESATVGSNSWHLAFQLRFSFLQCLMYINWYFTWRSSILEQWLEMKSLTSTTNNRRTWFHVSLLRNYLIFTAVVIDLK